MTDLLTEAGDILDDFDVDTLRNLAPVLGEFIGQQRRFDRVDASHEALLAASTGLAANQTQQTETIKALTQAIEDLAEAHRQSSEQLGRLVGEQRQLRQAQERVAAAKEHEAEQARRAADEATKAREEAHEARIKAAQAEVVAAQEATAQAEKRWETIRRWAPGIATVGAALLWTLQQIARMLGWQMPGGAP